MLRVHRFLSFAPFFSLRFQNHAPPGERVSVFPQIFARLLPFLFFFSPAASFFRTSCLHIIPRSPPARLLLPFSFRHCSALTPDVREPLQILFHRLSC